MGWSFRRTDRLPENAELVAAHYPAVLRFCVRWVGPVEAPDLAQETFMTAFRSRAGFRGECEPQTWLLGIARNQCRNWRRKSHRTETPLEEWMDTPAPAIEANLVDGHLLKTALESLSDEHREVVLLHEVEGLRYAEIAVITGVPEGTVKSRLHHAFRHLRTHLMPAQGAER